MTFFPFAGATWRMVGITPRAEADRYSAPILLSMRSFLKLTDEHRALIRTHRLRVVLADSGEDFAALGARTGWSAADLNVRLLALELDGQVARLPGGLFQRRAGV